MHAAITPSLSNPVPAARGLAKAALALALSLPMLPALAQATADGASGVENCKASEAIEFRGLTARLENDLFANTDRNYTNGVAFTAVSRDIAGSVRTECLPAPVRLHAELVKFLNPGFWSAAGNPAHSQNVVVKFGQSIYTPNDPLRTDLIVDDRPYAGLLYVGMSWNRRTHASQSATEMLDTREITLGVIGPWSLAEQAQNLVHDAIGADRFLGWEHQLKNEPALQLALDRKFKNYRGDGAVTPGLSADSIRSIGLRLGNIETSAALSIEGRIGWNIPNDFGTYPIRPGAENRPPSSASHRGTSNEAARIASGPRAGVHLFGTLEAKLVARDFSLDGNLFRSSHRVTRRPWVAQAAVGFSAQGVVAGHRAKLAVMRVYRSREFKEHESDHAYGSVALSIEY
ncbi:MAG: lipid A deacylase LpxR family protein [Rubrivivax sp.]|nr:lipid A deacylase LpxR family protein [Rubrivivax sp.]